MMASPGIGRQHWASCTDTPSLPQMVTGSSSAALLWSIGALAYSPPSRPKMWRATRAAMRLPMPMSAYSSSIERADELLAEPFIRGRELTVAVLGDRSRQQR